jgi:hypothetical protein
MKGFTVTETVQHVNVKIFATRSDINLVDTIPVFHNWIQNSTVPELLIDVADYKHVPDGPGIMLIGHEADYSLDETDGRLGLLYNRKTAVDGDSQAALKQAYDAAIFAAKKLEQTPVFVGSLEFDASEVEVILNDRLLTPNTEETWQAVLPELNSFFSRIYGPGGFTIEHRGEPRDRLRAGVRRNPSA